jgi:hypothetical protein
MNMETEQKSTKPRLIELVILYVYEFFEAFVSIVLIKVAMEKDLNMTSIVRGSAIIGLLTFILERYNPQYRSSVRDGITFTIGSQIISQHI